jgi:hypothetical protein
MEDKTVEARNALTISVGKFEENKWPGNTCLEWNIILKIKEIISGVLRYSCLWRHFTG